MRLNAFELLSRLISSYWFIPLTVTLGGVALAVSLLVVDAHVSLDPNSPLAILYPSSAEGARALLSAVIGAMITAVSVTFSVTVVALTVAAQHFGPRVLNSFVQHTTAQLVLGTFMATFAYSVLTLGAIRGTGPAAEVPQIAVSGAVALVFASVGALIYYVHYVSTTLQIGSLAAAIGRDLRDAVSRQHGSRESSREDSETPDAPEDAAPVHASESGYVQKLDNRAIAEAARERGAIIWIRREPGAFVVAGSPLALVSPAGACDEALAREIRAACIVGSDRTVWHDPEFALKQLVEIALRALSPGVNEPFTTLTCIDRLTEGLAAIARAPVPEAGHRDRAGRVRVWVQPQPFSLLLRVAFDPIRIFAGPNPAIYARLLESLSELALVVPDDRDLALLRHQADVIRRAAERATVDPEDLAYVLARHETFLQQERGRLTASRR